MRKLFFYGTLRHVSLLEIVLGRSVDGIDLRAASLPGYAVYAAAEGPFPTLLEKPGATAEGVLVEGLSPDDIARLDYYEGGFAYDLIETTLADGTRAEVYVSPPGRWAPAGPWSLQDWVTEYGAMNNVAAREVMGYYGRKTRDEVAQMFPNIRARASSKVRASQSRHGAGTLMGKVEIHQARRVYGKFFALDELVIRHEQFDGAMSDTLERSVFIAFDAAIVLPYDPVRDRVLLVEQVRMGPLARGDKSVWMLEPVAGLIDPGETPEQAAHRESKEEAGITLQSLEPVSEVYASPGNSSEVFFIFVGLADLPDGIEGTGGLESEAENIRSHGMAFESLMSLIDDMQAANTPLVIAALWLARHRDRLRSAHGAATP